MSKLNSAALSLLAFGLVALVGLIVLEGTHNLADPTVKDTLTAIALASLTASTGAHVATGVAGAIAANYTPAAPADAVAPIVEPPAGDPGNAVALNAGDVTPSDPTPLEPATPPAPATP